MPGGTITHVGAVRTRAVGAGNLILTCFGYDNILTSELVPVVLSATDSREKVRLANFTSQSTMVKFETREKDDVMRVNHAVIFIKPLWSQYPG